MTGLRLEVFSDETLPHAGPGRADNGNFHLSEVRVTARAKANTGPGTPIKLKAAMADFDQSGWGIARAIDGDRPLPGASTQRSARHIGRSSSSISRRVRRWYRVSPLHWINCTAAVT